MTAKQSVERYENHLGYQLNYQLHLPRDNPHGVAKPPILAYCVGYGGDMDSQYVTGSMQAALDEGVAVVRFNTTPVTVDPENPEDLWSRKVDTSMLTPSYYVQTLHAALKYTKETYGDVVDMDNLALNATSYGTRSSMYYAAHMNGLKKRILGEDPVPIKGLVLQAPVMSLDAFWLPILLGKDKWRKDGMVTLPVGGTMQAIPYAIYEEFKDVNTFRDIAPHVTCPVSIIHGTKDRLGRKWDMRDLAKSLTQASYVERHDVADAGHAFEDTKKIEALNLLPKRELRDRVQGGEVRHTRRELMMRYVSANFKEMTKIDEVVGLTRNFLFERVYGV